MKYSPKEQLLVEIPAKLDMYHRKYVRMNHIMDASYYKCLLQKVSLFQLKNKLGRASGVGSGRKRGKRGGRRQESAKEEGSMKPKKTPAYANKNHRSRKGHDNDGASKNDETRDEQRFFRSDCTDLQFETSAPCTKNM